ncbi:hypothetical protein TeGR_g603 [Tetraparma gracilis]|uniref:Uncharacterized protein n=1 Tax=Tetraparma gracilis TaxID=2962635 RepID=A0ABQ6MKW9_9STRA|nr:hypothetical protein TeGR_g603 [Tetraparma gracilis]
MSSLSFNFHTLTYIAAYVLLLLLAVVGRRPSRGSLPFYLEASVVGIACVRFAVCYALIFGASGGGGDMFTRGGVLDLFRTKGDEFVVGVWSELCTLFIVCSLCIVRDAEERKVKLACVLPITVLGFFVAGFGFVAYVLLLAFLHLQQRSRQQPP